MATTSTTSTTSSAQSTLSALQTKRASAQKIVTSLNAGSGVDVVSLAQGLADAERIPQENVLNGKISKNDARVSGYAAISFMLKGVRDAVTALKDASSFNTASITNTNPASFSATASTGIAAGSYAIKVNSLAQPQRSISGGFATALSSLNDGSGFSLSLSVNGGAASSITMAQGADTPQGVVDAINAAKKGVTAKLVNTGEPDAPFKIALTGESGAAQSFQLFSPPPAGPGLSPLVTFSITQPASNASVTVDGVDYTRSSNTISDVISGVTLDLKATATSAGGLTLARDTAQVKDKINELVTAYNEANQILNEVTNPKSTLDQYGATLVGDSVARQVKAQLRDMLLSPSSSPGTSVGALWQMGISVDKEGVMSVDNAKLDKALASNFADVVTTFTANQNNRSANSAPYSTSTGFASGAQRLNGGAAFSLTLTSSSGPAGIPIAASQTTPQGVVDAINASNSGYTAQLVNEGSGTEPFKIVVMGSLGSSSFSLNASSTGSPVSGLGFSNAGSGIAGDALRKLGALLSASGPLMTQSEGANAQNTKFKASLAALQTRMQGVLERYTRQFATMESLVGNINSQKSSLKSSFEGMMAMYTNK